MLVPAITRKDEIIKNFNNYCYTDDMLYITGSLSNWIPDIVDYPNENTYQYAVVDKSDKLIGFICYRIDWYNSCASRFGIFSFNRWNSVIGKDLLNVFDKLLNEFKLHRIEWRMVGGNPAERSYDKFCNKYKGTKHILIDTMKDRQGKYRNDIIYEIINRSD